MPKAWRAPGAFPAPACCVQGACGNWNAIFDAVPELAALVADLLEEMDALRVQAGYCRTD